jgi:hypothetical protein
MTLKVRWPGSRRRWIVFFRAFLLFAGDVRMACHCNRLGGRNLKPGGQAMRINCRHSGNDARKAATSRFPDVHPLSAVNVRSHCLGVSALVKGHSLPTLDHDDMLRIANKLSSLTDAPEGNDITRLRCITARRSPAHGMGLFALQPISGTRPLRVAENVQKPRGDLFSIGASATSRCTFALSNAPCSGRWHACHLNSPTWLELANERLQATCRRTGIPLLQVRQYLSVGLRPCQL